MEQIERIAQMEQILDEVAEAVSSLSEALEKYNAVQGQLQKLTAYYSSEQWRQDFDDDNAGKLPRDLKRGVLSEDAVYNLLSEHNSLIDQLHNLSRKNTCFDLKSKQKIHIQYDGIGFIPLEELAKKETA